MRFAHFISGDCTMSYHYQNSMSIVSFDARAKSIHIRVSKKTILILLSKNLISLFYQYILQLTQHPFFIHIIPNPNFFSFSFYIFLSISLFYQATVTLQPTKITHSPYQKQLNPHYKSNKQLRTTIHLANPKTTQ